MNKIEDNKAVKRVLLLSQKAFRKHMKDRRSKRGKGEGERERTEARNRSVQQVGNLGFRRAYTYLHVCVCASPSRCAVVNG